MLLPEDDNFNFRIRQNTILNVCPLRDFQREGQLIEEEMRNGVIGSRGNHLNDGGSKSRKRVRLEDLFRPPIELCFWGPFQSARDYASARNKWLMVNLQDHTEFSSQCLNRDVWSNLRLKNIIQKFFIFWQVNVSFVMNVM